ncbi:MAG: dimethyl sulfoxide reductase anchor subunit, partial [Eggerthellaceae bacterium]|nr:dimethyl sulfoxide reductase anchor subunit [Eggerthellaceae bacterium]
MGSFFGNWHQEAGLAIFTTLAPSGLVAMLLLLPILFAWGGGRKGEGLRLCNYLMIPLGVTLLGFVASTIQLGTPANALYVFTGIGRSPLSNEVLSVVVYFGLAGSYWMLSFGEWLKAPMARAWLVTIGISALFALVMMGRAYSIWTIPT